MELSPNDLLFIRKFGKTDGLAANTTEDVWTAGGTKTIFTAAEIINISSASANDDVGGTGATTLLVGGLDGDYNLQQEIVLMDGTTTVSTVNTYREVNRVRVIGAGSGRTNAGAISLVGATTAAAHATIPAGVGITQQSHFTIPAGYTCFTVGINLTCYRSSGGSGTKSAEIEQMVYVPSIGVQYSTLTYGVSSAGGAYQSQNQILSQTPEKTTLWFRATAETNGTEVSTNATYILVKEDLNFRTEI